MTGRNRESKEETVRERKKQTGKDSERKKKTDRKRQ